MDFSLPMISADDSFPDLDVYITHPIECARLREMFLLTSPSYVWFVKNSSEEYLALLARNADHYMNSLRASRW